MSNLSSPFLGNLEKSSETTMIIRFVQLAAFALIAGPLVYSVASFDALAVLKESGKLSVRANEFIATQKETGTSLWNEVFMQTSPPTTTVLGTQQYRTPCFALTIALPHQLDPASQTLDTCVLKVRLPTLHGRLSIQASPTKDPLAEQTAVVIRYQQPEQFVPVLAPQSRWPEAIQFVEPDATTLFVSSPTWTLSFAVTGISNPETFSFEQLLSTLEMSEGSVLQL
jgi:hypothetical protein